MEELDSGSLEPATQVDVLIVGAGLSGLTAAREIKTKSPHLKVMVVEAKDRVGGRTYTVDLKAANGKTDKWDMGHGRTMDRFDPKIRPEAHRRVWTDHLRAAHERKEGVAGRKPEDSSPRSADPFLERIQLESLVKTVNVEDLYDTPRAKEYDALSTEDWIRQNAYTRMVRDVMECATKSIYGIPSKRISFLYFLYYSKCAGNFEDLTECENNGAQGIKVKGGTNQISQRLAECLAEGELVLNTAVRDIDMRDPQNVLVHTMPTHHFNGKKPAEVELDISRIRCKRLLLAIPPNQCGCIKWLPGLPYLKEQLFASFPAGNLFKCIITYEKAFWREKGLSGEVLSSGVTEMAGEVMPVISGFDATTIDGNPAMVLFLNNEWADRSLEQRRSAVVRDLARFLGDEALDYVDYRDKDWHLEPFNGGCPVACIPPGNMEAFSHVREPIDLVHFAGTETATHWPGYLSGAIQAGYRAAHEVLFHMDNSKVEHRHLKGSVYDTDAGLPTAPDNSYKADECSPWPRRIVLYSAVAVGIYLYSKKYELSHTGRLLRPIERSVIKWWSGSTWP
ncbi:hypothetical protein L596_027651 [Steinernema carpocapsae]|uniref:Amine oxidase n=1 Tax=Steinernema carpocapsae TaxID=34508 RepID=A0A4U5LW53_STECR|nr:hypothetical protein L596_027651 [Steinernema carpocapsae]